MRLFELMIDTALEARLAPVIAQTKDVMIAGLTADSRQVRPGFLFAALPGTKANGTQFIEQAIMSGAVAVLATPNTQLPTNAGGIVLIEDPNPRRRFAKMAAKFFGHQPDNIAAITGTNGKTSVASFARQLWALAGNKAASLGTLGVEAPQIDWASIATKNPLIQHNGLTTPDVVSLHAELADLTLASVSHLAMEVSSHSLDQYRIDGTHFSVAAFTNLTRDHLDYHGSMGAYFNAKARLFSDVLATGTPVLVNADSDYAERVEDICLQYGHRVIFYGKKGRDLTLVSQTPNANGQELVLNIYGDTYKVQMPVAGTFQAHNALCALGMVLALEDDPKQFKNHVKNLEKLHGVRGRLELVGQTPKGAPVFVDYAHTPDALETVLNALRPHTAKNLSVVFGCGGDRDAGKRPLMGDIAARLANQIIVTDDNPRSENPRKIRQAILTACPKATEVADRREAIRQAVSTLKAGDVLVIAGKGHEQGQIIDSVTHPFDDATEARLALQRLKA